MFKRFFNNYGELLNRSFSGFRLFIFLLLWVLLFGVFLFSSYGSALNKVFPFLPGEETTETQTTESTGSGSTTSSEDNSQIETYINGVTENGTSVEGLMNSLKALELTYVQLNDLLESGSYSNARERWDTILSNAEDLKAALDTYSSNTNTGISHLYTPINGVVDALIDVATTGDKLAQTENYDSSSVKDFDQLAEEVNALDDADTKLYNLLNKGDYKEDMEKADIDSSPFYSYRPEPVEPEEIKELHNRGID